MLSPRARVAAYYAPLPDDPLSALAATWLGHDPQIEALYPLAPLQHGLIFHSLYAPGAGDYITQLHLTFQGQLDAAAFRAAWQQVLERYSILRTAVLWDGLDDLHKRYAVESVVMPNGTTHLFFTKNAVSDGDLR